MPSQRILAAETCLYKLSKSLELIRGMNFTTHSMTLLASFQSDLTLIWSILFPREFMVEDLHDSKHLLKQPDHANYLWEIAFAQIPHEASVQVALIIGLGRTRLSGLAPLTASPMA